MYIYETPTQRTRCCIRCGRESADSVEQALPSRILGSQASMWVFVGEWPVSAPGFTLPEDHAFQPSLCPKGCPVLSQLVPSSPLLLWIRTRAQERKSEGPVCELNGWRSRSKINTRAGQGSRPGWGNQDWILGQGSLRPSSNDLKMWKIPTSQSCGSVGEMVSCSLSPYFTSMCLQSCFSPPSILMTTSLVVSPDVFNHKNDDFFFLAMLGIEPRT
jgi:hypothetical protein